MPSVPDESESALHDLNKSKKSLGILLMIIFQLQFQMLELWPSKLGDSEKDLSESNCLLPLLLACHVCIIYFLTSWQVNWLPFIGRNRRLPQDNHAVARHPYTDPPTRHDCGRMNVECSHCKGLHWLNEKILASSAMSPSFGMCCNHGKVTLPSLQYPPPELASLLLLFPYGENG